MKSKMILACAGLAVCGQAVAQAELEARVISSDQMQTLYADTAQMVLGYNADGTVILGDKIDLAARRAAAAQNAGRAIQPVYDTLGLGPDTDGDGDPEFVCGIECGGLTGDGFRFISGPVTQVIADDIEFTPAAAGAEWDGGRTLSLFANGGNLFDDPPTTGVAEPLIILVSMYSGAVLDPVQDGTAGIDNDGDGVLDAPYDNNNLLGSVLLTFGTGPIAPGFYQLVFDGFIDPGTGISDFGQLPGLDSDSDGDGRPEMTMEIAAVGNSVDTDGDGAVDVLGFSTDTFWGLWGEPADDISGCYAANGLEQAGGTSTPLMWAEGVNLAGDVLIDAGWSDGGVGADGFSAPALDFFFDNTVDLNAFVPPANGCPADLRWAQVVLADFEGGGTTNDRLCADVNGDGNIDGSDFFAWVNAFGNSNVIPCDVNNDGNCDGSDFFAWVNFFGNPANDPGDCAPLP